MISPSPSLPENPLPRDPGFYGEPILDHHMLEGLEAAELADGLHTIWGYRFPIDFMLRIRKQTPLIVYFNGAVARDTYPNLPVLLGNRLMSGFEASSIVVSDAALHADPGLAIGWHAGAEDFPLPQIMREVIDHIAKVAQASRIIFCGPSAGGFAALSMAVHYPKSLTYVWNPQTDILAYNPGSILSYGKACFRLQDMRACKMALPRRISSSLIDLYANKYAGNTVLYTQNLSDKHVEKHANPFLRSLSRKVSILPKRAISQRIAGGVWYLSCDWGDGHVAPQGAVIRAVLRNILSHSHHWPSLTRNDGIAPILGRIFDPAPKTHAAR